MKPLSGHTFVSLSHNYSPWEATLWWKTTNFQEAVFQSGSYLKDSLCYLRNIKLYVAFFERENEGIGIKKYTFFDILLS